MLQRYDHPAFPVCPYPSRWDDVTDVQFDTDLVLVRLKDTVRTRNGEDADYVVGEDYTVRLKVDGTELGITVPRGLITDLTSVPAPLRVIASRVGPWLEAAMVRPDAVIR